MPAAEVQVTIGSVVFNDFSTSSFYLVRNTGELLATLSTRQTKSDRQGDHGVNDSLSFYNERILPFEGEICGSSQSDRKAKEDALKKALALPAVQSFAGTDGYLRVLVTDEDGTLKQLYAKVLTPPKFTVLDDADPARRGFTFVLMAKDPRLYSQTLQTVTGAETVSDTNFTIVSGVSPHLPFTLYSSTTPSLSVTNAGTFGAPPVITIAGPADSPVVTNATTGKSMSLSGLTVISGDRVVIDVNARSISYITSSGVVTDVSGYLTAASQWIYVEPGSNAFTLTDSSPDTVLAALTVQFRDTYI